MASLLDKETMAALQITLDCSDSFETVQDVKDYIDTLPEDERHTAESDILETMVSFSNRIGDIIEEFFVFVKDAGHFRLHMSEPAFMTKWQEISRIIKENEIRRDRLGEAKRSVLRQWPGPNGIAELMDRSESSLHFIQGLRKLGHKRIGLGGKECISLELAAGLVNEAMVNRLTGGGKWARPNKHPMSGDVDVAYNRIELAPQEITIERAYNLGMKFGLCGFLEPLGDNDTIPIELDGAIELEGRVQGAAIPLPRAATQQRTRVTRGIAAKEAATKAAYVAQSGDVDMHDDEAQSGDVDMHDDEAQSGDVDMHDDEAQLGDVDMHNDKDEEAGAKEDRPALLAPHTTTLQSTRITRAMTAKQTAAKAELEEDWTDDEGTVEQPTESMKKPCYCLSDVPLDWKATVNNRTLELKDKMELLSMFPAFTSLCRLHIKKLASHFGLATRASTTIELHTRIQRLYDDHNTIGQLKIADATYQWFRAGNRPARASDRLGSYQFAHTQAEAFSFDQASILNDWDDTILPKWESDGTINTSIFTWWFKNPALQQELYDEFDCYMWHLRQINGNDNIGWLRNMFYSLSQQLMRQDPLYYMLYAALRPDRAWRLISYPYYTKYSKRGNRTWFCHIDVNIPSLLANHRGASMIQGTVSMDDEDHENCTFIWPGMQYKLEEWWSRVKAQKQQKKGFIHAISDKMLSKHDEKALGVFKTTVPCRRGEVRISLPHLPHGATGPATKTRRTMLPWFMAIQDDEESLEVTEGGTWQGLSNSHRDQTAPNASPSGHPNRYGSPPYRFPAGLELCGLGALSDALVGRRRWSSPAVVRDRDIVLGSNRELAREYIDAWRLRATPIVLDLFQQMRIEEKRTFGNKSFYMHLEESRRTRNPMPPVVEPELDELDEDALEQARQDDMLYKEAWEECELERISRER